MSFVQGKIKHSESHGLGEGRRSHGDLLPLVPQKAIRSLGLLKSPQLAKEGLHL